MEGEGRWNSLEMQGVAIDESGSANCQRRVAGEGSGRGKEEGKGEEEAERVVEVGESCSWLVGDGVGGWRPPRSLPTCFINRTGAKSDAVSWMNCALIVGAPVFVTYQRSEIAVILDRLRMRPGRSAMRVKGEMLREMHGPERGVNLRMTQSSVM